MADATSAAAVETVLGACDLTNSSPACYTASWYLVWDQVRYWGLFQLPIIALAIVYAWLDLGNDARVERLRTAFDAPIISAVNYGWQIITCIYICVAWVVRGGSLAVSFSSWSVESFFLIGTAVGYGVRWISAKSKIRFVLQLHSLLDLLSLISHFSMSFQTYPVNGRERRSWLDFGFLRTYIIYVVVDHLFARYPHKTFMAQLLLVIFKAVCLVFVAACVLFSLERLGDLPHTNSFLLHVYRCSSEDGATSILVDNATGTDVYPNCSETWSFFSSIYFMFVTVSTVGYGDFTPDTVLGRLMVCVIIVVGIYTFANESAALVALYRDERSGRVRYNVSRNTAHVLVTGNPSAAQMKDFIREFFHPDHEAMFENRQHQRHKNQHESTRNKDVGDSYRDMDCDDNDILEAGGRRDTGKPDVSNATEDTATSPRGQNLPRGAGAMASKWMRRRGANHVRETHIVILVRLDANGGNGSDDGDDGGMTFQQDVMRFVQENPRYHKRVFLINGSPLRSKDLRQAHVGHAIGVFFLPNKFSSDGNREDAATVLRVLSVSQQVQDQSHLFAMLVNSENRLLVEATGLSSDNLVCADEWRLGLMGLSCRCPGLSTLVSNLITSRNADYLTSVDSQSNSDSTASNTTPPAQSTSNIPQWLREYIIGAANEIYPCVLAPHFHGLTFTQCTQRIHQQSDGQVVLLAIEYENETFFNPGHAFRIKPHCRAFVIAESVSALAPFSATADQQAVVDAADRHVSGSITAIGRRRLVARARQAQHNVERRLPTHVRDYIDRCARGDAAFLSPMQPPSSLVGSSFRRGNGGHIVVCSNVASDGGGSRSVSRLVSFLRPLRAAHIESVAPVVIVDAEKFDSVSWLRLSELGEVYHVHGSPQQHSVLVAAGVYTASAIVVLAQGTSSGYDDSKAIFNAILINAALERSHIFTIIELRDVHNNRFLDPIPSFSSLSTSRWMSNEMSRTASRATMDYAMKEIDNEQADVSHPLSPSHFVANRGWSGASRASLGRDSSARQGITRSRVSSYAWENNVSWWEQQLVKFRKVMHTLGEFFLGNLYTAATRVHHLGVNATSGLASLGADSSKSALENLLSGDDETFFQERFMRGALFPSYVADDLLVQSFFNPSLNQFIRKILDGTSCFMLYDLPQKWRRDPPTYGELFEYMTSSLTSALPIGLLRTKGGYMGAPHSYVYTAPLSSTQVHPDDKVFVIVNVSVLHRVASKLQRLYRSSRRAQSTKSVEKDEPATVDLRAVQYSLSL